MDIPPFMSYAAAYSLGNYKLEDPSRGMEYDNLRLVRAFECGLDPKSSEAGFILTHVDMVKESGALISGAVRILNSLEHTRDRAEVDDAYRQILAGMEKIEASMEGKITLRHFQRRTAPTFRRSLMDDLLTLSSQLVDRHVEELQAVGVSVVPSVHLWHHFTGDVSERRDLRRRSR